MRSSGSTRSPLGNRPVPLFIVLAGEDHPKACTGRRLLHRRLARATTVAEHLSPSPLVLDPYASDPLSAADRSRALRAGILAIDCSWNRLSERGRFPGPAVNGTPRRRLPLLIATNPQHYGRPAQLNTVEALAAALAVVGRPEQAARLLEGFRGSEEFLRVNAERLSEYRASPDADAVRSAERRLFGGPT